MASIAKPACMFLLAWLLLAGTASSASERQGLDFEQLAAIRRVMELELSPDGKQVAYTLLVPRRPGADADGTAWEELHLVDVEGGASRAYVHGEVNVSKIRFSPDGRWLTYLAKRGKDKESALWAVPLAGGESRKLLGFKEAILDYRFSPDGHRLAFLAQQPQEKSVQKRTEKGYRQQVLEEDWRHRRVWMAPAPSMEPSGWAPRSAGPRQAPGEAPQALEIEGSVFALDWSPDGKTLALAIAPRPLIDDEYMLRRVQIVDADTGARRAVLANPGKLGRFAFSPDGRHIAMISAADAGDPREGRLFVAASAGGALTDLLPHLEGHVVDFAWQDGATLMFLADQGVESFLGEVGLAGGKSKIHLMSGSSRPVMEQLRLAGRRGWIALLGQSPEAPAEVYGWKAGRSGVQRLTESNPWLKDVALARQEVLTYPARDGLELEGILLHPLVQGSRVPAPVILMVHGGPESHVRNGWVSSYSQPGQLAAGRGYAVFYPNYRGSTGRGVAFSKLSQGDAAGKEFDDLVDAVDSLIERGIADEDRVGVTGGSYGGYATAWCATRYSHRFRAGVMFVGLSNKLTQPLTTDIPFEDLSVHSLEPVWDRWEFNLERSPLYHAKQARTALLIAGGTEDSRVEPSQSLQLYRALKLMGQAPVRYVRYPGEKHGNQRAAARDDYTRRLIGWMDHFLIEGRKDLPPWNIDGVAVSDDDDDEQEDQQEEEEEEDQGP